MNEEIKYRADVVERTAFNIQFYIKENELDKVLENIEIAETALNYIKEHIKKNKE